MLHAAQSFTNGHSLELNAFRPLCGSIGASCHHRAGPLRRAVGSVRSKRRAGVLPVPTLQGHGPGGDVTHR